MVVLNILNKNKNKKYNHTKNDKKRRGQIVIIRTEEHEVKLELYIVGGRYEY